MCPGEPQGAPAQHPSSGPWWQGQGQHPHKAQLCTQNHSEFIRTSWSISQQKLLVCSLPHLDMIHAGFSFDSPALLQPTGSSGADMGSAVQLSRAGTRQIFVPKFSYQQELLLMPASCLARAVSCSYSLWCLSQANSCAWGRAALTPCDVYFILLPSPRGLKNRPESC